MSKYKLKKEEDRRFRKPTMKERRKLNALQKMLNKAKKYNNGQSRADKEAESRANALNDRLGGRKDGSKVSDKTKEFLVKCVAEVVMFTAYLISLMVISILIVLLLEPLLQLGTWITALIERGSVFSADNVVEIEHYQQITEPFSEKISNGVLGGIAYFLFFFLRRLIKGHWIHQE